jgi:hypothetical protein
VESGYPVPSASLPRSGPGVGAPDGAPHALNDLGPLPRVCYASAPTWRDSRAPGDAPLSGPGSAIPEQRPEGGRCALAESLGISLPCQVMHAIWFHVMGAVLLQVMGDTA